MFCGRCGRDLSRRADASFCPGCGAKVGEQRRAPSPPPFTEGSPRSNKGAMLFIARWLDFVRNLLARIGITRRWGDTESPCSSEEPVPRVRKKLRLNWTARYEATCRVCHNPPLTFKSPHLTCQICESGEDLYVYANPYYTDMEARLEFRCTRDHTRTTTLACPSCGRPMNGNNITAYFYSYPTWLVILCVPLILAWYVVLFVVTLATLGLGIVLWPLTSWLLARLAMKPTGYHFVTPVDRENYRVKDDNIIMSTFHRGCQPDS